MHIIMISNLINHNIMHDKKLFPCEPKYIICDGYYLKKDDYDLTYKRFENYNCDFSNNKPSLLFNAFAVPLFIGIFFSISKSFTF